MPILPKVGIIHLRQDNILPTTLFPEEVIICRKMCQNKTHEMNETEKEYGCFFMPFHKMSLKEVTAENEMERRDSQLLQEIVQQKKSSRMTREEEKGDFKVIDKGQFRDCRNTANLFFFQEKRKNLQVEMTQLL